MKNNPNFIAPVGPASSGKGHLVDALVERGYTRISLSDFIKDDLEVLLPNLRHTRRDLQDMGDTKRKKIGLDYWARRAGAKIDQFESQGITKFVIDSIRNPAELAWLKKNHGLIAIAIDAPLESRIDWAINRHRDIDKNEKSRIREDFERDLGIDQPEFGQNVRGCMEIADRHIVNNGTIEELGKKIEKTLIAIGVEGNHNHREKK